MLSRLKFRRQEAYSDLKGYVRKKVVGGETLFLPSLNFLFLLGLVDYHPKTDAIEYVGPNEGL
ncbi:ABC-three component system middle component 8 [Brevundimonas poindexterae]|uniref:ABC-three component system middle component 8 n=1 Tax=Brevundimonas poindexterae TaxID=74325 RepID=UPI00299DF7A0|nr:ABC-three component system middle component 8 [Brevundimonas poindexterae]